MNWISNIKEWFRKRNSEPKNPIVTSDDSQVTCVFPNGKIQTIAFSEIRAITVETNDKGPFVEDVYFFLFSDNKNHFCAIPQCAEGSEQLVNRLTQLPGFNNQALIEAMGCTSNRVFLCWEKRPWIGENWPVIVAEREKWNN